MGDSNVCMYVTCTRPTVYSKHHVISLVLTNLWYNTTHQHEYKGFVETDVAVMSEAE